MPNWCEGTFKVRGKIKDIRCWVKENLSCYKAEFVETSDNEGEWTYIETENAIVDVFPELEDEFVVDIKYLAHINLSDRHFIKEGEYDCISNDNGTAVLVLRFQSAWTIEATPFIEMSKRYNVDFRIYGCERGAEFNQEIIIENGKLKKDKEIKFDDYEWECPFPDLGG